MGNLLGRSGSSLAVAIAIAIASQKVYVNAAVLHAHHICCAPNMT